MSFSGVDVPTTKESKESFYKTLKPLVSAISTRLAGIVNLDKASKSLASEVFTPVFKKIYKNDHTRRTRQWEFSRKVFMLFSSSVHRPQ